jgi:hypothetical protein
MAYIGRTPTNAALTASDLADGIVSTAKIAADAVTDAKIADDVVGTEHLTANEVDTTALGADAVTGAQLADDAVNSEHYTDGSIDTAHIADGQITTAKLATAVFTGATDIGADIADADLFLMDDGAGGTIRKTAASRLKTYAGSAAGTLNFQANRSSDLSVSATTQTEIVFNAEQSDTDGKYNTSNGRYTPGVAGAYFVTASLSFAPGANVGTGANGYIKIRKNGSGTEYGQTSNQGSGDSNDESFHASAIIECDSDDYISVWWYHTATAGTMLSVQSWFSGFRLD